MRRMLLVPIVWALLASTATAQELRVRTQALLAERRQGTVTAASVQVLTGVTSITIEGDIAQADRGDPSNAMTVRVYLSLDGGFSWQPWGGFSWRGSIDPRTGQPRSNPRIGLTLPPVGSLLRIELDVPTEIRVGAVIETVVP